MTNERQMPGERTWSEKNILADTMYLREFQSKEGTRYVDATPYPVEDRVKYTRSDLSEWRPIETAPKDGSRFLVFDGEEIVAGSYDIDGVLNTYGFGSPSISVGSGLYKFKWRPLPAYPKDQ